MKKHSNIPVFHHGMNRNHVMISKELVESILDDFKNVPIIDYTNNDAGEVIGFVGEATNIDDEFVYADTYTFKDLDIVGFYNYEIIPEETHRDGDIVVIDKCKIAAVSFDLSE